MMMLAAYVFKGEAFVVGEDGRVWRITYDYNHSPLIEFVTRMPERRS